MSNLQLPLHRVLALDAACCALMGAALVLFAGPVADATGLPDGVVRGAGALLLPVAFFIALVARQPSGPGLLIVVLGNILWIAASLIVLTFVSANAIGMGLVIGQAGAVALLTALESRGLVPVPGRYT